MSFLLCNVEGVWPECCCVGRVQSGAYCTIKGVGRGERSLRADGYPSCTFNPIIICYPNPFILLSALLQVVGATWSTAELSRPEWEGRLDASGVGVVA